MHPIAGMFLGPNVGLKGLRFDDLRGRFPVTNMDRGHVRQ
jgi:hypothetical protein